ncbi:MAG: hypothetical protein JWO80_5162 [Bryobacterales bacterium]|nr:hypothetical protein [Bryobacterales bacterium]
MNWSGIGAIFLAAAVMLGAFGAHALRARLDAYSMGIWEKAVFYHFVHALGMLITPVLAKTAQITAKTANGVSLFLAIGILFFSGSLYALALSGVAVLGAVTPLGGLAFIAAWLWLGVALIRARA